MRDIIISLANRMPMISPASLFDVANAYYESMWGAAGLIGRNPSCEPKLSYVAYAALTKALDGVVPFESDGIVRFALARTGKSALSEVWFTGSGQVASIYGDYVDASVARAGGVRYDTLEEACASGGPVAVTWPKILAGDGPTTLSAEMVESVDFFKVFVSDR